MQLWNMMLVLLIKCFLYVTSICSVLSFHLSVDPFFITCETNEGTSFYFSFM